MHDRSISAFMCYLFNKTLNFHTQMQKENAVFYHTKRFTINLFFPYFFSKKIYLNYLFIISGTYYINLKLQQKMRGTHLCLNSVHCDIQYIFLIIEYFNSLVYLRPHSMCYTWCLLLNFKVVEVFDMLTSNCSFGLFNACVL